MQVKTVLAGLIGAVLIGAACGGSEPDSAPTSEIRVAAANASAEDVAAIEQLFAYLNDSNAAGPNEWLTAAAVSNYLVSNGTYTPEQCIASTKAALGLLIGARLTATMRPETLVPLPGKVQPVLGSVPVGRVYKVTADVSISPRNSPAPSASVAIALDIAVLPDGNAKTFGACE